MTRLRYRILRLSFVIPGGTCRDTTCQRYIKKAEQRKMLHSHFDFHVISNRNFFWPHRVNKYQYMTYIWVTTDASNGKFERRFGAYIPDRLLEYRSLLLSNLGIVEEKPVELIDKLFRLEPWGKRRQNIEETIHMLPNTLSFNWWEVMRVQQLRKIWFTRLNQM